MKQILQFFLFTFLVSWAFFWTAVVFSGPTMTPFISVLVLLGTITPAIVALLLAAIEGSAGALVSRILEGNVGLPWYAFAIFYMLTIKLSVAVVYRAWMGTWPRFGTESWMIIAIAILFSTPVQAGEELGWRGYALPQLAKRLGYSGASLLLGIIWGIWHLPLFFIGGTDKFGQSIIVFVAGTTALSVAIAWLYIHVNGSLLLTMLMHSAVNQTVGVVPSAAEGARNPYVLSNSLVAWLTVALLWICSAYFLARLRKFDFSSAANRPA